MSMHSSLCIYLCGILVSSEACCSNMTVSVCFCLHECLPFVCVYVCGSNFFASSEVRAETNGGGGHFKMCVALVEVSAAAYIDSVNAPCAPGAPAGSQRQTA